MAKHKQNADERTAEKVETTTVSTVQTAADTTDAERIAEQERINLGAGASHTDGNGEGGPAPEKPKETKAQSFRRLANKRVPKAMTAIGYVANLTNEHQYEWTADQAERIVSALRAAVDAVERGFSPEKQPKSGWSL